MKKVFANMISLFMVIAMLFNSFPIAMAAENPVGFTPSLESLLMKQGGVSGQAIRSVTRVLHESFELDSDSASTNQTVVDEVPLYDQIAYPDVPYGNYGTVRSHGCGIACLAMVATYLLDDPTLTPDVLAEQFGCYNTKCGSAWSLFIDSAEVLGLGEVRQVHDWPQGVEEALRNGSLVISNQVGGVFTQGGHYILLTGITEDGKVMVHDPNSYNWNKYPDQFENGFNIKAVSCTSTAYWIYEPKK